jgi:hypothetical protein
MKTGIPSMLNGWIIERGHGVTSATDALAERRDSDHQRTFDQGYD